MARKRMIDPSIWTDEGLGQLSLGERLLFIGIISFCDDDGVCKASPKYLKATIFPYDDLTIDQIVKYRDRLADTIKSVYLYTDENEVEYIQLTNWTKYQKITKPLPTGNPKPTFKKKAIPLSVRREIAVRHGLKGPGENKQISCHYCGKNTGEINWMNPSWVHFSGLEMDHVVPESMGGANNSENIVLACKSCNRMRNNSVVDKSESSKSHVQLTSKKQSKPEKKESTFGTVESIMSDDLVKEIATHYNVTEKTALSQREALILYRDQHPNKYKNLKSAWMNFVRLAIERNPGLVIKKPVETYKPLPQEEYVPVDPKKLEEIRIKAHQLAANKKV